MDIAGHWTMDIVSKELHRYMIYDKFHIVVLDITLDKHHLGILTSIKCYWFKKKKRKSNALSVV